MDWDWDRAVVVVVVVLVSLVVARLVDRRMARRELTPGAATRYRVLRRSIVTGIMAVGVLSALLTIPAVATVAGGILASSAVAALVLGFAAQSTLSNFVAGILIAFAQPLRIGDLVEVGGVSGVVEEIGLTYTFIRLDSRQRLVIPNAKLAADTIVNSTIVSREKVAEITVQIPLDRELRPVLEALRRELQSERNPEVFVSGLNGTAAATLRAGAPDEEAAEQLERELRVRAHERLRAEGLWQ
jgi:small conductance mechanosensitive channel